MVLLNYPRLDLALEALTFVEQDISKDVSEILAKSMPTSAAYDYSRKESQVYPKWLNLVASGTPDEDGIDEQRQLYTIRMQLQIGPRTQGTDGSLERQLYVWIPYTLAVLRTHPRLESESRPIPAPGLLQTTAKLVRSQVFGQIIGAVFEMEMDLYVSNVEADF